MVMGVIGPTITGKETVIWKCEGASDTACLLSLPMPEGHIAITNQAGAMQMPSEEFCEIFKSKVAMIVHDCDEPGQLGAIGTPDKPRFGPYIARHAKECRNVVLPYPIVKNKGKDLTNWINDRRRAGVDDKAIYKELFEMAMASPVIEPCKDPAPRDFEPTNSKNGKAPAEPAGDSKSGGDQSSEITILEADDDPHRLARVNLEIYERESGGKLVCWNDQFWRYRQGVYRRITIEDLKAKVTATIRKEFEECWKLGEEYRLVEEKRTGDEINREPILKVTTSLVTNVIAATRSICSMPSSTSMPSWLPTGQRRRYLSLGNGILDLDAVAAEPDPTKWLLPHSSDWFSSVKAPYDFDVDAKCDVWQQFLSDVFNDDDEAIETLQRWFGYILTQDTYLHKMLLIIGEKRSGKGTIARTLRSIIGTESVATPTMSSISGQYELDGMVDKSLAIIGDARLSKKTDETVITERLLSITGGDPQDVQRKYLPTLRSVDLPVRFMMLSNVLPSLSDASAAIVSRCIVLNMPNSYYGRENLRLGDQIKAELPGVLLWAIIGANKLRQSADQRIDQPKSGKNLIETFESIVSPVSRFVDERCEKNGTESIDNLYIEFIEWLKEVNGQHRTKPQFAKELTSVCPSVDRFRKRIDGKRTSMCQGLSIKDIPSEELF